MSIDWKQTSIDTFSLFILNNENFVRGTETLLKCLNTKKNKI